MPTQAYIQGVKEAATTRGLSPSDLVKIAHASGNAELLAAAHELVCVEAFEKEAGIGATILKKLIAPAALATGAAGAGAAGWLYASSDADTTENTIRSWLGMDTQSKLEEALSSEPGSLHDPLSRALGNIAYKPTVPAVYRLWRALDGVLSSAEGE